MKSYAPSEKSGGGNAHFVKGKMNATLNGTISIPTPKKATRIYLTIWATDAIVYGIYNKNTSTTSIKMVNTNTVSSLSDRSIGASNCPVYSISDNEIQLLTWTTTIPNRDYEMMYTTES